MADPGPPITGLAGHLAAVARDVGGRYHAHAWREDLIAEAQLAAYQALVRTSGGTARSRHVALSAGRWAVANWLRSARNGARTVSRRGNPLPTLVPWDAVAEREGGAALVEPDFAAALVERLTREGLVERVLRRLAEDPLIPPRAAQLVRRVTMGGEPVAAVARELGVPLSTAWDLRRAALARLRAWLETNKEGDG